MPYIRQLWTSEHQKCDTFSNLKSCRATSLHTFIKVQARGPFPCIHCSKLLLGGHFVACIRQSWSPIAIAIGLHGVSSTPAALRSLHFFSTPISPWARPDCVRWGSVTGRKKQEKKCNATHCAAFFSKPSARTKNRKHFF